MLVLSLILFFIMYTNAWSKKAQEFWENHQCAVTFVVVFYSVSFIYLYIKYNNIWDSISAIISL